MKRILVTGGCGFVGSSLALRMRAEYPAASITCLDNFHRRGSELNKPRLEQADITVHRGDVRHRGDFPSEAFDLLIECSAEPSVMAGSDGSVDFLFGSNVVGLYECLEKCRRDGSALMFLSTSRIYPIAAMESHPYVEAATRFEWPDGGDGISRRGVSESLALAAGARSLYGATKLAGELLIEEYRAAFGLRAVVNRCGVIAGPWQFGKTDQGVVSLWAQAHCLGRALSYIGYGGSGKQVRDLLHIDDLADLVALQVRQFDGWDGFVGNVSGGLENSLSLRELTELCIAAAGSKVAISAIEQTRPNDLRIYIGDCARLYARTPWRPRRPCAQIVEDTVRWVNDQRSALAALA